MKRYAPKGKLLYCEELGIYCTCTPDDKHDWVEVDEEEANNE